MNENNQFNWIAQLDETDIELIWQEMLESTNKEEIELAKVAQKMLEDIGIKC